MLKKFQKNYKMFVLNKLYKKMCVFNKSVYLSRSYSEGREVRRLFTSYNILEKVYMVPKLLPKPWMIINGLLSVFTLILGAEVITLIDEIRSLKEQVSDFEASTKELTAQIADLERSVESEVAFQRGSIEGWIPLVLR